MKNIQCARRRISRTAPLLLVMAAALSACSSMTGVGGSSQFSCKAPSGVHCSSLSGNYHNSIKRPAKAQGGLPDEANRVTTGPRSAMGLSLQPAAAPLQPATLRAEGKLLRLWLKAWEDTDNDLVDQSFVYLQVDKPRWQVAHVQRLARSQYAPVTAPAAATQSGEVATPPTAAAVGAAGSAVAAGVPVPESVTAFDTGLTTGQPSPMPVQATK